MRPVLAFVLLAYLAAPSPAHDGVSVFVRLESSDSDVRDAAEDEWDKLDRQHQQNDGEIEVLRGVLHAVKLPQRVDPLPVNAGQAENVALAGLAGALHSAARPDDREPAPRPL